jgi:hypothetical protein
MAWTFKWLIQKVIPDMLGFEFLNEIELVIIDGDKPETSPLDIGIGLYFPRVMRLRCGWHIMDRGWLANGPKSTAVLRLRFSPPTQSGSKRKNKSNKKDPNPGKSKEKTSKSFGMYKFECNSY